MKTWILVLASAIVASAFENREAKEDAAILQVDGYFGLPGRTGSLDGDIPFSRAYVNSFFPLLKIAGRDLVGSAEFSLMPRGFTFQSSSLNGKLLQSYGLGLGFETVHSESQTGFAYVMAGINGDMRGIGPATFYGDVSYTHQFNVSERLMLGGGIDFHFYFNDYVPYPVLLLDWRIADHTKIKIDFDTGEIKQFLTEKVNVSLGAQYDIMHYAFGRRDGYVLETIDGMARLEYGVSENVFVRLAAKRPFWGGEKVRTPAGKEIALSGEEGMAVRLQAAYGI